MKEEWKCDIRMENCNQRGKMILQSERSLLITDLSVTDSITVICCSSFRALSYVQITYIVHMYRPYCKLINESGSI